MAFYNEFSFSNKTSIDITTSVVINYNYYKHSNKLRGDFMQKLSDSELEIMMKIWEEDRSLYLEEIIGKLEEFNWVESTIRNFLSRIIDKGYLKTKKDGRKNIYIALVKQDYINKQGRGLIKDLYSNSIKKFVAELYDSDSIDLKDLQDLKDYLDEKIEEGGE